MDNSVKFNAENGVIQKITDLKINSSETILDAQNGFIEGNVRIDGDNISIGNLPVKYTPFSIIQ